jgi:tetratricopeptide (TPR) repeat protein
MGNALVISMSTLDEAVDEYEAALRIDPNLAGAHLGLAAALAANPARLPEARAHLATALRIQPGLRPPVQLIRRLGSPTTDSVRRN